jgi:hypothetical protein
MTDKAVASERTSIEQMIEGVDPLSLLNSSTAPSLQIGTLSGWCSILAQMVAVSRESRKTLEEEVAIGIRIGQELIEELDEIRN